MQNTFTFKGPVGEVRWSYHTAATLKDWTLSVEQGVSRLTAQVVSSDAFRVSQQPLTFVVPRSSGPAWRWPIQSLQVSGPSVVATLGPPEE